MTKIIAVTAAAVLGLLVSGMPAKTLELPDSINFLLDEQQLADFCEKTGKVGNTRIKIKLPDGTAVYGSITCGSAK